MLKALLYALATLFIIAVVPTVGTITYYFKRFLPYENQIIQSIERAAPAHKNPPALLPKMALAAVGREKIYTVVAEALLKKLNIAQPGQLWWHLDRTSWKLLIKLHYSDKQSLILWSEFIRLDELQGFESIAQAKYQKPMQQLTPAEITTIIVLSSASKYLLNRPEELQSRVKDLVEHAADLSRVKILK